MFAIPWHGHTVVGTTDTPIAEPSLEPARDRERDRVHPRNGRAVPAQAADARRRAERLCRHSPAGSQRQQPDHAALSRDHTIHIDPVGAAHDDGRQVDHVPPHGRGHRRSAPPSSRACREAVRDEDAAHPRLSRGREAGPLAMYGCDAAVDSRARTRHDPSSGESRSIRSLPYTGAQVVWAAREEMARTVEDVLARRTRPRAVPERARRPPHGAGGGRACSRASSDAMPRGSAHRSRSLKRSPAGISCGSSRVMEGTWR